MNKDALNNAPVALITGAARRIGAAIATQLQRDGFRVMVHYHHSEAAATHLVAQFNQSCSDSASLFRGDLCQTAIAQTMIDAVITQFGRLDVLVNNASLFSRKEDDWAEMFACNVQAPFELSKAAFPYLKRHQGSIINITDIHASIPLRDYAVYCQTKAALTMQTKAFALEFAPHVRVNAIAPGAMIWPEGENVLNAKIQDQIIDKTLLKKHGDPSFITQAVMYLIENNFVTAQILNVDGGRYLA